MPYELPYRDAKKVKERIKKALWTFEPSLLILFTVKQYKKKCNKRRCIAIYDIFVATQGPWGGAFGDSNTTEIVAIKKNMEHVVNFLRALRAQAQEIGSQSLVSRILSSNTRDYAVPDFFDRLMELSHFDDTSQGCLFEFMKERQPRSPLGSWRTPVVTARAALKEAGFDTAALGLDSL